jgi:hypothetical protein
LGGVTLNSSGISGSGFTLNNSGLNLSNVSSTISLGNGVTLNSSGLSGTGFSLTTSGITATAGTIGSWKIGATTLESTNNRTILDASNNSITTKDTTSGDIRIRISNETTLPAPSSLANSYKSVISGNYTYSTNILRPLGETVYEYRDGNDFLAGVTGVYSLIYSMNVPVDRNTYVFVAGDGVISGRMYVELYNVTDSTVVFSSLSVPSADYIADALAVSSALGGFATTETTRFGRFSTSNSVSLVAGKTYKTRAVFEIGWSISSTPSAVYYYVTNFAVKSELYTANTRTTINSAGFQSIIDGGKFFQVKSGNDRVDFTTLAPSNYSVHSSGDYLLDGVFINDTSATATSNESFLKFYPSLVAQCIVYSEGGSSVAGPGLYKVLNGSYAIQFKGDGIASVTRSSTGIFVVTMKRNIYTSTLPNVIVSGTGEQYDTAYTSTKYSVSFIDNRSFRIRCVRSNDNTMVDPFTLNIAVFTVWDNQSRYD